MRFKIGFLKDKYEFLASILSHNRYIANTLSIDENSKRRITVVKPGRIKSGWKILIVNINIESNMKPKNTIKKSDWIPFLYMNDDLNRIEKASLT